MNLMQIKVGDIFLVGKSWGWSKSIDYYTKVICESVTEKMCIIGGKKYRKSDGIEIGHNVRIYNYSDDLWEKSQKFLRKKEVENFKYCDLPNEYIKAIYAIICKTKELSK
jgi:hypothetical protein